MSVPRWALPAAIAVACAAVAAVGALDAWTFRHTVGPDGVSYLDAGHAYFAGHVGAAINAYWSPLYSIVVGAALAILPVSSLDQFAVAHAINLLVYVGALVAFAFFVRELLRYREAISRDGRERLPAGGLWLVGLAAFGWGVGRLITTDIVTPDLMVAAAWFAAMGFLTRSLAAPASRRALVALGLVLGVGYLAKTAMLPFGLAFVAVAAPRGGLRRTIERGAVVLAALLAVSLPYVVAASVKAGEPTIGTNSKLTYAWYVHGRPAFVHLPAPNPVPGLEHAPAKLLDTPPTFAFDKPRTGTFPLWFDPTYWYAGTKASFDLSAQVHAVRRNATVYRHMFRPIAGPALVAGLLLLLALAFVGAARRRAPLAMVRLLIPPLFALALYSLDHVEGRFVGAFLASLVVVLYAMLPWPLPGVRRAAATAVLGGVVAVALWSDVRVPVAEATHDQPAVEAVRSSASNDRRAARALRRDFRACRRIALVGAPLDLVQTYFPRLADMRITAAVIERPPGWSVSPRLRSALAKSRAEILIARDVPTARREWAKLGSSDYSVYRRSLRPGSCTAAAPR